MKRARCGTAGTRMIVPAGEHVLVDRSRHSMKSKMSSPSATTTYTYRYPVAMASPRRCLPAPSVCQASLQP